MLHLALPILALRQYLNVPKKWLQSIHPADIHSFSIIHNLCLHVFSMYIFINLFSVLLSKGISSEPGFYFNSHGVRSIL